MSGLANSSEGVDGGAIACAPPAP
ncbi:hypothetical protein FNH07_09680 [Amycolatopsis bartoniae]|nr:hypothetical protein FNH07_09680 [Amycolatopsis bartoniae]